MSTEEDFCLWQLTLSIISFKDCEHSVVQLTRPVKLRRTPFRSRQSLRASIIYKGPVQFITQQSVEPSLTSAASAHEPDAVDCGGRVNGALPLTDCGKTQGKTLLEQRDTNISHDPILILAVKILNTLQVKQQNYRVWQNARPCTISHLNTMMNWLWQKVSAPAIQLQLISNK